MKILFSHFGFKLLDSITINNFVYEMSKSSKNHTSQFARVQHNLFKYLVLSDQQKPKDIKLQ